MPNTNEKLNLPIVNAIEDLKASNTDNRQRLQKSMRAGMLNIKKSVDSLNDNFIKAFELQKLKDQFDRERALEESRKDTKEIQTQATKADKKGDGTSLVKLGLLFGGIAAALGVASGSLVAWTTGVTKAGKAITSFVGKLVGISQSGKFAKISAGLDSALKSVKGWNSKILDVLKAGVGKLTGAVNAIKNSKFVTTIGNWFDEIKTLGSKVASKFKAFSKTSGTINNTFKMIKGSLSAFGAIFNTMSKLATKVFWPISIILASFTAIKDSFQQFADGDILGGLKTVVTTLVDELFAKPLDMVKNAIAWVIGKLGFDETSDAIKSFSFSDLWKTMMDGLFKGISAAIDWVILLFKDPLAAFKNLWEGMYGKEGIVTKYIFKPISKAVDWVVDKFKNPVDTIKDLWDGMYGEGGIIDWLIFQPISDVVNWVRGLFGWDKDKDGKELAEFNLRDFVVGVIDDVWKSITDIFDSIKNFDFYSITPDWFQEWKGVGKYAKTAEDHKQEGLEIIRNGHTPRTDLDNEAEANNRLLGTEEIRQMRLAIEWLKKNPTQKAQAINEMSKLLQSQGHSVNVVAPVTNTDASQRVVNQRNVSIPAGAGRNKGNPTVQYEAVPVL